MVGIWLSDSGEIELGYSSAIGRVFTSSEILREKASSWYCRDTLHDWTGTSCLILVCSRSYS